MPFFITSDPKLKQGRPIIVGTATMVRTIAACWKLGMSVDEILENYSHLTPSQVFAALTFYWDNREAIDRDLGADQMLAGLNHA
ncbi:MAG TPA: DUF433 domain-containing protein [Armatimonadetes bacterium]|nr:DUF433 domain-containing protein [Armatimonadota bacterium]